MAGGTKIPVHVGCSGAAIVIRPVGLCTLAACKVIKPCLANLKSSDADDLYFDLSEAASIDSTFTGMLLAQAREKTDPPGPAVHLLNPSPPVVEALERMHVLTLFDTCTSLPDPPTNWTELTGEESDRAVLADMVLQAHQCLADADPRNAETFRPVIEGLQAEQRRLREVDSPPDPS